MDYRKAQITVSTVSRRLGQQLVSLMAMTFLPMSY